MLWIDRRIKTGSRLRLNLANLHDKIARKSDPPISNNKGGTQKTVVCGFSLNKNRLNPL